MTGSESDRGTPLGRSLSTTAARGGAVTAGLQGTRIALQLLGLVVLARLLEPADYGLVAMVAVFVTLGEILRDFGLSSAAVRAPSLSTAERDNLFWTNTAIGGVLCILAVAGSGAVASLYNEPRVEPIAAAIGVVFLLNGASTQYRAGLQREMQFLRLGGADLLGQGLGLAVAIALALMGFGYWALVAQVLSQAGVVLLLLIIFSRWLPGGIHRKAPIRSFVSFGWWLVGSQLVSYVGSNIDTFMVGRLFGAEPLGIYSRAYQMVTVPLSQVQYPATTVALPVLARVQDDQDAFDRYLQRGQQLLGYTLIPILALIIGLAEPIVDLVLGDRWAEATPYLRLFAIAGIMTTLPSVGYWAYLSRAATRRLFHFTILSVGLRIVCVLIGSRFGVIGVAVGFAVAPTLSWPLSLWWLSRTMPVALGLLLTTGARILAVAAVAAGASYVVFLQLPRSTLSIIAIGVGLATVAAVYAVMGALVKQVRRDETAVVRALAKALPRARRSSRP